MGNSVTRTGITTVISRNAKDNEQGEALGLKASANALGQSIPAILAGVLAGFFGSAFPLQLAAIIFVVMVILVRIRQKYFISEQV